jgi:hypothetical protein
MSRNNLFVITLLVVSALAAYVAYGMFAVGTMKEFEMSKMYFAAAVLAFLAFIFMLAAILYGLGPEAIPPSTEAPGKAIFDACVKVIPPMVTLIIGFYFGTTQDKTRPVQDRAIAAQPSVSATTSTTK